MILLDNERTGIPLQHMLSLCDLFKNWIIAAPLKTAHGTRPI